jgi:hypothetical protein
MIADDSSIVVDGLSTVDEASSTLIDRQSVKHGSKEV